MIVLTYERNECNFTIFRLQIDQKKVRFRMGNALKDDTVGKLK